MSTVGRVLGAKSIVLIRFDDVESRLVLVHRVQDDLEKDEMMRMWLFPGFFYDHMSSQSQWKQTYLTRSFHQVLMGIRFPSMHQLNLSISSSSSGRRHDFIDIYITHVICLVNFIDYLIQQFLCSFRLHHAWFDIQMFHVAGSMCWACLVCVVVWVAAGRPTSIGSLTPAGCCAQWSVSNNGEGSSPVQLCQGRLTSRPAPQLPSSFARHSRGAFSSRGLPKSRAEGAIGPVWKVNVLTCSWDGLETGISYWWFTRVSVVDLCLLYCQAAVWGWYQRPGDGLCAPIRAALHRSVKS